MEGYLRGDADAAELAVALLDGRTRAGRLRHDEAAAAEAQIDQLLHGRAHFQKRVLAADAAVGAPRATKTGASEGPHDDVVDPGVGNDECAARIGKSRHVEPGLFQTGDGLGVQGAFGHGDAQRAARGGRGVGLGRGGGHGLLQREGEARGGTIGPEGAYHAVVAAAGAQRRAQVGRAGLEDEARVVVEGAGHREVDEHGVGQTGLAQKVVGGLEVVQIGHAPERGHERAHRVDGVLGARMRASCRMASV